MQKLEYQRRVIAVYIAPLLFMAVSTLNPQLLTAGADKAIGYGSLEYSLPAVGGYRLPSLGVAIDGRVLDARGEQRRLHQVFGNKFVLMAFIYSSCSDVNGCPLSSHVFYQIKAQMRNDPVLADNLKLVSLSFDPRVDTPEVMRLYGENFAYAGDRGEWQFLTTASESDLKPLLEGYNQQILRDPDPGGKPGNTYSHLLRVYLIDPEKRLRNIYSVDYLHQALVLNDFRTLLQQHQNRGQTAPSSPAPARVSMLSKPGDDKTGYEDSGYQTNALALEWRKGTAIDLLQFVERPPLGLPAVPVPKNNPITREKVELGRQLFFDRRLSLNDTFSCAMCHVPDQGFTSNELAMAVGIEGRSVRRNSPTIYNSAYAELLFHDGREESLEQQAWGPLLAKNEMGNPSIGAVLRKIRGIPEYQGRFEAVFDGRGVTMETLGMALASYQRTLVSADSAFDRWAYGGQEKALSEGAKRGYALFTGKAGCSACHLVNDQYALFTDNLLHNTGVGYLESMGIAPEKERVLLAPGVYADVDRKFIREVGEALPADLGRYEVTQDPGDRWKYKTPTLRNVALTAPYMHNGSLSTLEQVVDFYDRGGVANEVQDPLIKPLRLNGQERRDLVSFLRALTGSNVDALVADAFAAPVGDITADDPNWAHAADLGEE